MNDTAEQRAVDTRRHVRQAAHQVHQAQLALLAAQEELADALGRLPLEEAHQ